MDIEILRCLPNRHQYEVHLPAPRPKHVPVPRQVMVNNKSGPVKDGNFVMVFSQEREVSFNQTLLVILAAEIMKDFF